MLRAPVPKLKSTCQWPEHIYSSRTCCSLGGLFLFRDQVFAAFTDVFLSANEEPIPELTLTQREFQLEIPSFGEIVGMETVPVPTPRTPAGSLKIAWLIPEGTLVEQGDTVVGFDKTDAQLSIEIQENSLAANQERTKVTTSDQEVKATGQVHGELW